MAGRQCRASMCVPRQKPGNILDSVLARDQERQKKVLISCNPSPNEHACLEAAQESRLQPQHRH